ncbi:outer membrane protein TolC [Pseudomonas sp. BIGb0408]|uniref:Outer membrane protein TolC n=1 Tax=Phytopseudomonas flavescens TaxID=29435 RepID=A0A7Z0BPY9_9GAMM|nr:MULTISPECIES: TolC family protein [Pseudomonas]MCW2292045.1 outer membrane protein TolC [Pseudomonas sp. BIGb0408]NYH73384.1 outer membrane protein TolC [Pseudomonas flavescens]
MHSHYLKPLSLLVALALGGCSSLLSTPYERPALNVPASWQQPGQQQASSGQAWWTAFNDAELDRLIDAALARNNDIGTALLNVRRARLQAGLTRDGQFPQLSSGLSADRTRALRGEGSTAHSYSLTGSVSWEADLWNRLGSATDAAELEALATEQDYAATRLSLAGTVATLYWQIGYLNERLAASAASIEYARQPCSWFRCNTMPARLRRWSSPRRGRAWKPSWPVTWTCASNASSSATPWPCCSMGPAR